MELDTLILSAQDTLSVPEMRSMLGIGKTESYWILKHRKLETVKLCGQIRILKKSFEEWYDHQVKYKKVDGTPPGQALRAISYSTRELAALLSVSDDTIRMLIHKGVFETFTVDCQLRITRESFERWYASQSRYMNAEDRKRSEELLASSYSMPEIARMLGIHRNTVYSILKSPKHQTIFEYVVIGGQKRITVDSFERWFSTQKRYELHELVRSSSHEKVQAEKEALAIIPEEVPEQLYHTLPQPAPSIQEKSAYNAGDLQKALGISRRKALAMILSGEVDAIRTSRGYIIPRREYERLTKGGQMNGNDHSEE